MQKATFSVIETAEYIGIGRNKIYQLINEGIIPSVKIGRQFRLPIKSIDQWLETEAQKSIHN